MACIIAHGVFFRDVIVFKKDRFCFTVCRRMSPLFPLLFANGCLLCPQNAQVLASGASGDVVGPIPQPGASGLREEKIQGEQKITW